MGHGYPAVVAIAIFVSRLDITLKCLLAPNVTVYCPLLSEFFERTILCNSLVWSCALTGRAGLTYLEAMESERRARQSLKSFPRSLVVPLLHLAAISHCSRLSDLCEDVYMFIKNRFFPGEAVEITGRNGDRYEGGGAWLTCCLQGCWFSIQCIISLFLFWK